MNSPDAGAGLPATERALVGLCHGLNDQLAALNAYVFLLERRGTLDESDAPLRAHLDRLAGQVRLVRSLARDPTPDISPVGVSLLAEAATEIMDGFPEGSVIFEAEEGDGPSVVRCDWNRALRALVLAGAWLSRETKDPKRVTVIAATREALHVDSDPPEEEDGRSRAGPEEADLEIVPTGPGSIRIDLAG